MKEENGEGIGSKKRCWRVSSLVLHVLAMVIGISTWFLTLLALRLVWILAFFPVITTVISVALDAVLPPRKMAWICVPDIFGISLFTYQLLSSFLAMRMIFELTSGPDFVLPVVIVLDMIAICLLITTVVFCCKLTPRPSKGSSKVEEESNEENGEKVTDTTPISRRLTTEI